MRQLAHRLHVLDATLARAGSIVASFAMSVVAARELDPSAAGTFFVVVAVLVGAATLGRFGTDTLALKTVAARPSSARATAAKLSGLCLLTCVPVSLMTAPLLVLVSGRLEWPPTVPSLFVSALSVIPMALSVLAGALLRASGHVGLGTLAELGSTPILVVAAVLLAAPFWRVSLQDLLYVFLGACIATASWALPMAIRLLPNGREPAASKVSAGVLAHMMGTALAFYLLTWSPVLALAWVSVPGQVAYYAVAARLVGIISIVPAIQVSYLSPAFAALHHRGETRDLNRLAARATTLGTVVAATLAAFLVLFPKYSLGIFGPNYDPAAPSLQVLAVGSLLVVAAGPVSALMLTCGMERVASSLSITTLTFTVALLVVLGKQFGALGAAIAFSAGTLAYATAGAVALRSDQGIKAYPHPRRLGRAPGGPRS